MIQWLKQITVAVLILTTPVLGMNQAIAAASTPSAEMTNAFQNFLNEIPHITYDQVLDLLDAIENGALDQIDNPEEIDRILKFVAYITQKGSLFLDSDDASLDDLESDTEELLSETDVDFFDSLSSSILKGDGDYCYSTAELYESRDVILCKSWAKKKIDQAKKYVKKHKKAFIIGGAVAVAAVAVVCIAAAAATAGTAALGEAGDAAASGMAAAAADKGSQKEDRAENEGGSPQKETREATQPLQENPVPNTTLSVAVEEQIEAMQEANVEKSLFPTLDSLSLLGETAREIGSSVVHEMVDGSAELGSFVPRLQEEIQGVADAVFPGQQSLSKSEDSPTQNYEKIVASAHEFADQVFSTDHADIYSPEAKAAKDQFTVGLIPLPGSFKEIFSNATKFNDAGKLLDRAGFIKSGRALMKHGNREGSVFPKPKGSVSEVNKQGQMILEEILSDPNNKVYKLSNGDMKVYSSNGRGAYYKSDGSFRGFIEKQYE